MHSGIFMFTFVLFQYNYDLYNIYISKLYTMVLYIRCSIMTKYIQYTNNTIYFTEDYEALIHKKLLFNRQNKL